MRGFLIERVIYREYRLWFGDKGFWIWEKRGGGYWV